MNNFANLQSKDGKGKKKGDKITIPASEIAESEGKFQMENESENNLM